MKTNKVGCKHEQQSRIVVQGVAGPMLCIICKHCAAMISRTPWHDPEEHQKALQRLAANDGAQADRYGIEPCTHGREFVFTEQDTCSVCAAAGINRLLASIDLRRLP